MELTFPIKGQNVGLPSSKQPEGTSRSLNNVRPYFDGRAVGGQRPGLDKWGDGDQIGGTDAPIIELLSITTVD